jgi:hypothetical protein
MATTTINVTNQLQDLQSVTDEGALTTNPIYVGDLSTSYSEIGNGAVGTANVNNGTYAYIGQDGILGLHNGDVESQLKNTDVSVSNSVILEFPDKTSGSYTIATLDDISVLYSATFFDTTTQNNGGATTANQVKINTTQQSNGFTLSNNSIEVLHDGVYFINLLMQLAFTGGASNYNVTVWFTVDDAIVPNSGFTFTTTGAQNDQTLANITDTIALTSGQVLKFYWWSQAAGMKLLTTAAGSNPTRPASPSVNFTIFNVG